ncbi:LETM1 domain-containing protein 1 isoform X1 [Hydra vulgaris]|uniref:LETM1 domain-containing protein 1 n=1 Tax=Hydra vulgaris TaxID=6087 RepID=T2MBF2_HYDVU|nr:LETM1 domain-containing protein 1 [Hydra vulgaris]
MASCSFFRDTQVSLLHYSKFLQGKNYSKINKIRYISGQCFHHIYFQFPPSHLRYQSRNLILDRKFNQSRFLYTGHANFVENEGQYKEKDSTKSDTEIKKISRYQKFKSIVKSFGLGCSALLTDIKLALQIRRKLGLYKYQENLSAISRDELLHMRQTRKDVAKTFPVAMLFMVPFLGYAAPIIAYFYPRQLLSQQFWHPDQKEEFLLEEYEKRSQYYIPLIQEVGVISKEINNKQLLQFCLEVLDGKHPENKELLQFHRVFSQHEELSLNKMTRYHLVKLCQCWLIPTGWFLPRWYLVNSLRKRISHLHEDDTLILRDGIDELTPSCIEHAVHVRGLDELSLCIDAQRLWLTDWIQLSSNFGKIKTKRIMKEFIDRKTVGVGDHVTFLAHCAVFKAANFESAVMKKHNLKTAVIKEDKLEHKFDDVITDVNKKL